MPQCQFATCTILQLHDAQTYTLLHYYINILHLVGVLSIVDYFGSLNDSPHTMLLAGLRHKCNSNNDCEDGMVCQFDNNRTIGVSKFMSSKTKLCLCDNDNGYVEDILHDICSAGGFQKNQFKELSKLISFSNLQQIKKLWSTLFYPFVLCWRLSFWAWNRSSRSLHKRKSKEKLKKRKNGLNSFLSPLVIHRMCLNNWKTK